MIRRALLADAAELAVIHISSWQAAYQEVFPEEFLHGLDIDSRTKWFEDRIRSGSHLLVAGDSGGLSGFCFTGASADDGWAEVFAIYVRPQEWGEGHGYRLLRSAEQDLAGEGWDRVLLWVLATNQRAREFYERQGWHVGKPIRIEEIGGVQVTEVRYEKSLLVP